MHYILLLLSMHLPQAAPTQPTDALVRAKDKINTAEFFSFSTVSYWPDIYGILDTTEIESGFYRKPDDYLGFDYWSTQADYDIAYKEQVFSLVTHSTKEVTVIQVEDFPNQVDDFVQFLGSRTAINYSPIGLLKEDWTYQQDSVHEGVAYALYRNERAAAEGNRVVKNLWVDQALATIHRQDRWVLNANGAEIQQIIHVFSDYTFSTEPQAYAYTLPEGYVTAMEGDYLKPDLITVGTEAPAFSGTDLNGKPIVLEDLRGKRVVLDFSTLNCGYCKLAIKYVSPPKYQMDESVVWLYINPQDDREKLEKYQDKLNVPFPVVPLPAEVGITYGVWAYPTFVVVDEEGKVEQVYMGYSEEFLDQFRAE